jgi:glucokinase
VYIGIDLGGTNVAAAIVDADGRILKRTSIHTDAGGGAKTVIEGLVEVCDILLHDSEEKPQAIGIGVPGTVNDEAGEIVFTPNLPLRSINITRALSEKFGCPIRLGNDANCAALGEMVAGGARGAKDVAFITLGTGLGGGVVLGGRLHTGLSGAACEPGHMVIYHGGRKCGCGRLGCWESYGSATGLAMTASEFMDEHPNSVLWLQCGGDTAKLNGRVIFDAFRAGDRAAQLAVERYAEHLAAGILNLINILEPEMICVGGGISNAWDCLAEPIQKIVDAESFFRFAPMAPRTKIVKAELGNDAGIIGAAMLGLG